MRLISQKDYFPWDMKGAVLAIGNFDGVHPGHQALLHEARALAQALDQPLGVLTFDPHPRAFFAPEGEPFQLTRPAQKLRQLAAAGVDYVYSLAFDGVLAAMPADRFVRDILIRALAVSAVVVGQDFRFGTERTGDADLLRHFGEGEGHFAVRALPPSCDTAGVAYSSTRVRDLLAQGRMEEAEEVLGRPWEIEGAVVRGDQRGRTIGFPTANQRMDGYIRPRYGVYAALVAIDDETPRPLWLPGVANIGIRPMYESPVPLAETHIFDFDRDIYGCNLRLWPVRRIRGEARFATVEDLVAQIQQDCREARAILGR